METELKVRDRVTIHKSSDPSLDGQSATIMGAYGSVGFIVLFDSTPENYNPAIVMVPTCLRKI